MNSIRFTGYVLYVIGLIVLLNSCLDYGKLGPYIPMPAEFKSYTVFPKGSYWIYKDSASSLLDSINEWDTNYNKLGGETSHYVNDVWIFSYKSTHQLNNSFHGSSRIDDYTKFYVYSEDIQTVIYDYPLYFDADTLNSTYQYNDHDGGFIEVTYKKLIPSMTIGSNVFTDVRVFEQSKLLPHVPNTLTHRVYIAKNIGIIRRELFNGEMWELQKYFINK
jgi:hypothetical protein